MAAHRGPLNGPSHGDALAVLAYYVNYYHVRVSYRIFPVIGAASHPLFGLSFDVYDCYGAKLASLGGGYYTWPSTRFATFEGLLYRGCLDMETTVREVCHQLDPDLLLDPHQMVKA